MEVVDSRGREVRIEEFPALLSVRSDCEDGETLQEGESWL